MWLTLSTRLCPIVPYWGQSYLRPHFLACNAYLYMGDPNLVWFEVEPDDPKRPGQINLKVITPRDEADYIDNRLDAVGFSIYLGGYHLYCTHLTIPVLLPENHVSFSHHPSKAVSDTIFDDYVAARAATIAAQATTGDIVYYAWYRGAGGALVVPTVVTRESAPRTFLTIVQAIELLASDVQQQLTGLAMGMVAGAVIKTVLTRIIRAFGGNPKPRLPPKPQKVQPVNGTVNVGGGLEKGAETCTNLNPVKPGSGGASSGIPNHVQRGFEEIEEVFDPGSVEKLISNRLRHGDVTNWTKAAQGAYRVMKPGGKVSMNVWCQSQAEVNSVLSAFSRAGFKNVKAGVEGIKGTTMGTGTIITGVR